MTDSNNTIKSLMDSFSNKAKEELSGSWWALPEWAIEALKSMTGKDTWTLKPYKKIDGLWAFDLPHLLTWGESLMGGTEKAIDYYYEKLSGNTPDYGDMMLMTVSSKPIDDATCILTFEGDDSTDETQQSSFYKDIESGILCWLCPYLPFLFGGKPEKLYLKLNLITEKHY